MKPHLTDILGHARSQFLSDKPQFFPGSTIADLSPTTMYGLGAQANMAMNNPVTQGANQLFNQTIGGQFLGANPYAQAAYDAAAQGVTRNFREAIRPGIDAAFTRAGRSQSSGQFANTVDTARQQLGDTLNRLAQPFFFDQYGQERGRQMQALGFAPQMSALNFGNIAQLRDAGSFMDERLQQHLNEQIARHDFAQNVDAEKLARYAGLVRGTDLGKTISTERQIHTNPFAQALGALLSVGKFASGMPF